MFLKIYMVVSIIHLATAQMETLFLGIHNISMSSFARGPLSQIVILLENLGNQICLQLISPN